jgi:hypothetical protein
MPENWKTSNLVKPSKTKTCCGVQYSLTRGVGFLLTFILFILWTTMKNDGLLVAFLIFGMFLALELFSSFADHCKERKENNKIAPAAGHATGSSYVVYIPTACSMHAGAHPMQADGCCMNENVYCMSAHAPTA